MNRQSEVTNHDVLSLEQKIAQLYFEAANMRLWKEKDAADAAAARESDVRRLVAEINRRGYDIARLKAAQNQLDSQLARARHELLTTQEQLQKLSTELALVLQSASWRLTKALRGLARFYRSRRKLAPSERQAIRANGSQREQPPDQDLKPVNAPSIDADQEWETWSAESLLGLNQPTLPRESSGTQGQNEANAYLFGGKEAWNQHGLDRLNKFFANNERIAFPFEPRPVVTIIIVSYNMPHLLLLNLLSIKERTDVSYRVVIIDNGSDQLTQSVLGRIDQAKIVKNGANRGFPSACMQGAACSNEPFLCFLNNDVMLEPNCLSAALNNFSDDETVGAVGGRILLSDGRLQEAGSILWCDGTTNGYGYGDDPEDLRYLFRRPVDFCSGAFLVTPRKLFEEMGGFDEQFSPGYYEDADYCTRLWSKEYQVIYEPLSLIRHYGNAGSANKGAALSHVIRNHQEFYRRWQARLSAHFEPRGENYRAACISASDKRMRILAITGEIPHPRFDAEQLRVSTALSQLVNRGHVTCAATNKSPGELDYEDISRDVELLDATVETASVIRGLVADYDLIWLPSESSLQQLSVALADTVRLDAKVELDLSTGVQHFRLEPSEEDLAGQRKSILSRL